MDSSINQDGVGHQFQQQQYSANSDFSPEPAVPSARGPNALGPNYAGSHNHALDQGAAVYHQQYQHYSMQPVGGNGNENGNQAIHHHHYNPVNPIQHHHQQHHDSPSNSPNPASSHASNAYQAPPSQLVSMSRRASMLSEHSFNGNDLDLSHSIAASTNQTTSAATIAPPTGRKQSVSKNTPKLYALRIASQPGIYRSWAMAKTLIEGCPGAKYKGFVTVEECMQFIWEGFPNSTFTVNENGDYIMDDPEPVFQVIEEARQKKEKNSGLLLADDMSSFEPNELSKAQAERIASLFQSDPLLQTELNSEQKDALDAVKAGNNLFVSGAKKTGKDLLLSHIYNHLVSVKKSFHITSASVITSQNSNSTYTLGWTGMGKALGTKRQILSKVRKNTQARKAWSDVSCLIIKDCSMLPAFLLDIIDFLAREIRKEPNTAFGGIQIILVGSTHGPLPQPSQAVCCPHCGQNHRVGTGFCGLGSQVGQFITCSNEECKHMFINSWILYPFEAAVWDEAKFTFIELKKSFQEDERLSELVQEFSKAPPFSEKALEALNRLMEKTIVTEGQMTSICANNEEMNKMNDAALLSLSGDSAKYEAIDTVLNNFDFSSRAQQKEGPTDEIINLKAGTQILIISANGRDVENGVIVDFVTAIPEQIDQFAKANSHGMSQVETGLKEWLAKNAVLPRVRVEGETELRIIPCRAWIIRANGRAAAWRIQLPVRLAYGISLAKGQDLSLNKIMISASREWLIGEMYMALNFAKSFDSIYLDGLTEASFTADSRVLEFTKAAVHGSICTSVKTNNVPEGFFVAPPNVSSLKRHSVAAMGGGSQKKRRPSKQIMTSVMPSFMEESGNDIGRSLNQGGGGMADPQLLRYQQMSQRRHSYQPLTSYQEQQQQFAFLQSQMIGGQPIIHQRAATSGSAMMRGMVPMGLPNQETFQMQQPDPSKQFHHRSSISYEGLPNMTSSQQQQQQQKTYSQSSPYEASQALPMMIHQNLELTSPNDMMQLNIAQSGQFEPQQHDQWQSWQP